MDKIRDKIVDILADTEIPEGYAYPPSYECEHLADEILALPVEGWEIEGDTFIRVATLADVLEGKNVRKIWW